MRARRPLARRRPGSPGRRRARVVALVLLTGAITGPGPIGAGPARADDSPVLISATVYAADGSTTQDAVTLGQLDADPSGCPPYSGPAFAENTANGSQTSVGFPPQILAEGTWPLASALACMTQPISPAAIQAIVVFSGGAAENAFASLLGPADLTTPSDFANPEEVPVVSDHGSTIEYDRPARGPADDDYDDQVTENAGTPISIAVYAGQDPLSVTINPPTSATIAAGTQLSLSATVSGGEGALSYAWTFGGGATDATGADPNPTFTSPGVYAVDLQVSDADGDVGQAQPVRVTVTAASTATQTQATPPATTPARASGTGALPTGPVKPTGATGTPGGAAGRRHRHGNAPSATGARAGSGASGASAAGTPAAGASGAGATAAAASATQAPVPGAPAAGAAHAAGTAADRPAPRALPHGEVRVDPTPAGSDAARRPRRISGRLIPDPLSRGGSPRRPDSASRGTPSRAGSLRPAGAPETPGVVFAVAAVLLLLALGVLAELRGPRGRLSRRRDAILPTPGH